MKTIKTETYVTPLSDGSIKETTIIVDNTKRTVITTIYSSEEEYAEKVAREEEENYLAQKSTKNIKEEPKENKKPLMAPITQINWEEHIKEFSKIVDTPTVKHSNAYSDIVNILETTVKSTTNFICLLYPISIVANYTEAKEKISNYIDAYMALFPTYVSLYQLQYLRTLNKVGADLDIDIEDPFLNQIPTIQKHLQDIAFKMIYEYFREQKN